MHERTPLRCLGAAAALLLGTTAGMPLLAQDVTPERLVNSGSETGNWLTVHRTYNSQRFSPLDQINQDTVKDLSIAFVTTLGIPSSGGRYAVARNEGTPLVEDGFMYLQSGWSVVTKIDVRDGQWGRIVWQYTPEMDRQYISDTACCGAENRGIALVGDQVIAATMDGVLFALDKNTGDVNWERQVTDRARAETFTVPPLVIGDTVIMGPAGAEYGIRGWLEGIDVNTGDAKWRTYTVAGPDDPGFHTWEGRAWETGGGSIWQAGSYDPELNLVYYGTGNPGPDFDSEYRPGDNLYTDSLLALNPDTGKIVWYFQYTPNDPFDYDEIGVNPLIDIEINGEMRHLVTHVGRNGIAYALDRATGEFIWGEQYLEYVIWTDGVDPVTGKPSSYDPNAKIQDYKGVRAALDGSPAMFCPRISGGTNWQPTSYSPITKRIYGVADEGCDNTVTAAPAAIPDVVGGDFELTKGKNWMARGPVSPADQRHEKPAGSEGLGSSVYAIDVTTGKVAAKKLVPVYGTGALATAGNLVFISDGAGYLRAYDPDTLDVIWERNVGTPFGGPPMTYAVDGKQYIAVLAGDTPHTGTMFGGADTLGNEGDAAAVRQMVPTDALYVFALPGSSS